MTVTLGDKARARRLLALFTSRRVKRIETSQNVEFLYPKTPSKSGAMPIFTSCRSSMARGLTAVA